MKRSLLLLLLLQACALPTIAPVAKSSPTTTTSSSTSNTASTQSVPAKASADSKYETLLKTISCPKDEAQYGAFADTGYYQATRYCNQQAPAGYWVWLKPNWYVWKNEKAAAQPAPSQSNLPATTAKNSYQGKYRTLLQTIDCPSERASDEAQYGKYGDAGYFAQVEYCGKTVPAGYWVYVAPSWYLWAEKDLAAIGFEVISREVKLKNQTLTLRFEYAKANKAWAQQNLDRIASTLLDLEARTGVPYPGVNPYTIEESPTLKLLGLAGPSGMKLISPPKGTPWTFLHEAVHIWNASQSPTWVIEGHANYFSFLMMRDLKFPFIGDETYAVYIDEWRDIKGTADDLPLDDHYLELPQGKAMEWWAMVHELFGPDFVESIFVKLVQQKKLSTAEIGEMIRTASGKDPAPLLDGWIRKGSYKVNQSSDFGPVKFPLPDAWPK